MEVQMEGLPALDADGAEGIEPVLHELRIATRGDAATVLSEVRALRDGIEAGKQRQAFIKDARHHVSMAGAPEEL